MQKKNLQYNKMGLTSSRSEMKGGFDPKPLPPELWHMISPLVDDSTRARFRRTGREGLVLPHRPSRFDKLIRDPMRMTYALLDNDSDDARMAFTAMLKLKKLSLTDYEELQDWLVFDWLHWLYLYFTTKKGQSTLYQFLQQKSGTLKFMFDTMQQLLGPLEELLKEYAEEGPSSFSTELWHTIMNVPIRYYVLPPDEHVRNVLQELWEEHHCFDDENKTFYNWLYGSRELLEEDAMEYIRNKVREDCPGHLRDLEEIIPRLVVKTRTK